MDIRILQLLEGAKQAEGLTVIIDVFRAFSVACYAAANGAERIIPVGDIEQAYRLKEEHPAYVLMGERGGVIQPGFDYGNSPTAIEHIRFDNRTIVHTTSAGTQGLVNAARASEIITGSFVNAAAIAAYIQEVKPEQVSLVAMGWGGREPADEDTLCAQYIADVLMNKPVNFSKIVDYLANESKTGRFLDLEGEASAPAEDFDLCLALDRFPFVLKATQGPDGHLNLIRKDVLV